MITLRQYQTECVKSVFRYYGDGGVGHIVLGLPTGTGKSLVLAELIRQIFAQYPTQRVMALTHVKELIKQNADEILKVWPLCPLGINSAGLGRRDYMQPVIYGGVASVINNIEMFGHRDLLFIDEAHLLSPDDNSLYQRIITILKQINPYLKVIGLTATLFRLGQGLLTQGGLFTDCPFNICTTEGFHRLIIEGYLSPPIPRPAKNLLDVSKLKVQGGEFTKQSLNQISNPTILQAGLAELCEWGHDRQAWLIFNAGIQAADDCAAILQSWGIPAASVHSEISQEHRDERIAMFKSGELRAITNNNILTTGFNHPAIDLIGMFRPTMSASLWVQMLGRGTRPSPDTGKKNCIVLDFAGNTKRLGPIDDPQIPKPKGKGTGDAPVKICDCCGAYNHTRVRFCIGCGAEFDFEQKIVRKSDTSELLTGGMPKIEFFNITRMMYNKHTSKAGHAGITVNYYSGLTKFSEFLNFESSGMQLHHAHDWWRKRFADSLPRTNADALNLIKNARVPKRIKVWLNLTFPKVMGEEW